MFGRVEWIPLIIPFHSTLIFSHSISSMYWGLDWMEWCGIDIYCFSYLGFNIAINIEMIWTIKKSYASMNLKKKIKRRWDLRFFWYLNLEYWFLGMNGSVPPFQIDTDWNPKWNNDSLPLLIQHIKHATAIPFSKHEIELYRCTPKDRIDISLSLILMRYDFNHSGLKVRLIMIWILYAW